MVEFSSPKRAIEVRILVGPQKKKPPKRRFFLLRAQASKLLCSRRGFENLFVICEELVPSKSKRCTDPVRIEYPRDRILYRKVPGYVIAESSYFKNCFAKATALLRSVFFPGSNQTISLFRLNHVRCLRTYCQISFSSSATISSFEISPSR